MIPIVPPFDITRLTLEALARFDTSGAQRLDIERGNTLSGDPLCKALLPMKNLLTLTLARCKRLSAFAHALNPNTGSSEVVVCPKLGELVFVLRPDEEKFDLGSVIEMTAARALGGAKLRTVRIVDGQGNLDPGGVLELRKHVLHIEYGPLVGVVGGDDNSEGGGYGDEDDWGGEDLGYGSPVSGPTPTLDVGPHF